MKSEPIYVFVGTDPKGGCAECQMVYEYSLKKHASGPVEIIWMKHSNDPNSFWYGWNSETWPTPFSGFRYGIANYCQLNNINAEKVIYTDDDQLWLDDVYKLHAINIPSPNIMTGKLLPNGEFRHCVSVINVNAWNTNSSVTPANYVTDVGRPAKAFPEFVNHMKQVTFPLTHIIDGNWNNYDGEDQKIEDIKLLHYTNMSSNPGVKLAIKRLGDQAKHWFDGPIIEHRRKDIVDVFHIYYQEALDSGYKVSDYIQSENVDYNVISQKNYEARNGWDK